MIIFANTASSAEFMDSQELQRKAFDFQHRHDLPMNRDVVVNLGFELGMTDKNSENSSFVRPARM
jgi:hypothetical protein